MQVTDYILLYVISDFVLKLQNELNLFTAFSKYYSITNNFTILCNYTVLSLTVKLVFSLLFMGSSKSITTAQFICIYCLLIYIFSVIFYRM